MSPNLPFVFGLALSLIGGGITLAFPLVGIPVAIIGFVLLVWAAYAYLVLKRLGKLTSKRVHIGFKEARFDAIGMSSPCVDFYFTLHSCLPNGLRLSGQHKGDLWNPRIERWQADWLVDTQYADTIKPDKDIDIRVRWHVRQGFNSPMTELAFRANDNPPEQHLTFEDMSIEVKANILWFEKSIGWLHLPGETILTVPDHHVFGHVRRNYLEQRSSN